MALLPGQMRGCEVSACSPLPFSGQLPLGTVWLLSDIAEAKGRQELYTRQSPQILQGWRDMAMVESVESSNRIEGVTVEPARLRPLVLGNTRPRDRSEEEIQGYRNALQRIHTKAANLPITPETLRELHRTIQEGAGDAGQWKGIDNDIIEFRVGEAPRIRFRPVSVAATPAAIDELCVLYRHALDQQHVPSLVAVACLVLDYLCVHPFRDGNGRVSRLLTVLALYHHGFEVGRYVSLERLIEESKEDYYAVLQTSSAGWHEGTHSLLPWLNYFLAVVRRAYVQFEERAREIKSAPGTKIKLIQAAILAVANPFRVADLQQACPGVSVDWIRSVLKDLRSQGKVECLGRGQQAQWRRLTDELGTP
ncbi:MAG: Fic family protein [Gemmataceae bacterium]|nr:Fic family protein [Gemmataceae bacterium]